MCIACECAGDECNKRDRSSGLDQGRCSIGLARHGSHPKKSMFDLVLHLRRVEFGDIGLAYFSPPQCEAGHRCKKFFEGRSEETKEMAMSDETQFRNWPRLRQDVGELTQMLKSNLEKVVQHGKRADSIVKNMLQHSREGSGEHRPADINAAEAGPEDQGCSAAVPGVRARTKCVTG